MGHWGMTAVRRSSETERMLDRIEQRVADRSVREQAMFGVVAVMLDESMLIAVGRDGGLLARVDAAEDEALLERPEAHRAEMGTGRSMGPGWLRVDAGALASEETLDFWIACCLRRIDAA